MKDDADYLFLEGEVWKDVEGYIGRYQISNKGRVRSYILFGENAGDQIIMKPQIRGEYSGIKLSKFGSRKIYLIHRLVAIAFLQNPLNLPNVNHKDGDKYNNAESNLEWCSQKDNIAHARVKLGRGHFGEVHHKAKLTKKQVAEIREKYTGTDVSYAEIGRRYGVTDVLVSRIIRNIIWKQYNTEPNEI